MVDWQLVLIAWGEKYGAPEVNALVAAAGRASVPPQRTVLITDRLREGLHGSVIQRDFPAEFLLPEMKTAGCHAKLAMFAQGVVPDDMVALYIDLDTVVIGDLSNLIKTRASADEVYLLQSAILPFGAFARWLYRISNKRRYARGNSSLVSYHPARCDVIASQFLELKAQYGMRGFRPMAADERFISWVMQPHMRAVPNHLAVKFPTEFMYPWLALGRLINNLPWVRRRRESLVAITLPGEAVKAEVLLDLAEGAVVTDRKGRKMIWSDRYLGYPRERLIAPLRRSPTARGLRGSASGGDI